MRGVCEQGWRAGTHTTCYTSHRYGSKPNPLAKPTHQPLSPHPSGEAGRRPKATNRGRQSFKDSRRSEGPGRRVGRQRQCSGRRGNQLPPPHKVPQLWGSQGKKPGTPTHTDHLATSKPHALRQPPTGLRTLAIGLLALGDQVCGVLVELAQGVGGLLSLPALQARPQPHASTSEAGENQKPSPSKETRQAAHPHLHHNRPIAREPPDGTTQYASDTRNGPQRAGAAHRDRGTRQTQEGGTAVSVATMVHDDAALSKEKDDNSGFARMTSRVQEW